MADTESKMGAYYGCWKCHELVPYEKNRCACGAPRVRPATDAACVYFDDPDDGPAGPECGRPARWYSCIPYTNSPTCDEHKCRCAKLIADVEVKRAEKAAHQERIAENEQLRQAVDALDLAIDAGEIELHVTRVDEGPDLRTALINAGEKVTHG